VLLPEVMAHVTAARGKIAGPPFSRYHSWSETEIDLEAGIPVQQPVAAKGRVASSELPAGKAVTCWHVGPYDGLGAAHAGLQAHLAAQRLQARGGAWEVYWTDPGMVKDQAKWKTQLFAPIE
jgi:effector-binding domain-containing protein